MVLKKDCTKATCNGGWSFRALRIGAIFVCVALLMSVMCVLDAHAQTGVLLAEQLPNQNLQLGRVLYSPQGSPDPDRPFVRLAVNPFALPNPNEAIIDGTIQAFVNTFGENNFRAEVISDTTYASQPEIVDLVLGSAGTYAKAAPVGARPLATLSSGYFPNPNKGEGAVFVVLNNSNIHNFGDMKGKRAVFLDPNAFAGYAVALGEIARRGEKQDTFFSSQIFANASMPREIDMLRSKAADVAVLRTCFLEELEARKIDVSDLRVVGARSDIGADFRCQTSTALYPNWTIFSMPKASPVVARSAAATLLNMPVDHNALQWSIASDFTPVDELYRQIELGPYEFLRTWTWQRFWNTYRTQICCVIFVLLALIAYAFGASNIIYRRTQALRDALQAQKQQAERIRQANARIDAMQNSAAIAQMSHAIAHNLRQPLSAIVNFSFGIRRLLDVSDVVNKDLVAEGVEKIQKQAELAESIVQKVRGYNKKGIGGNFCDDIRKPAQLALQTLLASHPYKGTVKCSFDEDPIPLAIDGVEIELVVINLVKNALEAVENQTNGRVVLSIHPQTTEAGTLRIEICVSDNGSPVSEPILEAMNGTPVTTKVDGMGLGIAIVRMIAEKHGGQVLFSRGQSEGIQARVVLPAKRRSAQPPAT